MIRTRLARRTRSMLLSGFVLNLLVFTSVELLHIRNTRSVGRRFLHRWRISYYLRLAWLPIIRNTTTSRRRSAIKEVVTGFYRGIRTPPLRWPQERGNGGDLHRDDDIAWVLQSSFKLSRLTLLFIECEERRRRKLCRLLVMMVMNAIPIAQWYWLLYIYTIYTSSSLLFADSIQSLYCSFSQPITDRFAGNEIWHWEITEHKTSHRELLSFTYLGSSLSSAWQLHELLVDVDGGVGGFSCLFRFPTCTEYI